MRKDHLPILLLIVATLAGAVLGIRARLAMNRHDEPIPASEPRAEIAAHVDLAPRVRCDEAFDLALYTHSGVELVTWDTMSTSASCRDRHIVVKYVPNRIKRTALLERIGRLAVAVRVD